MKNNTQNNTLITQVIKNINEINQLKMYDKCF